MENPRHSHNWRGFFHTFSPSLHALPMVQTMDRSTAYGDVRVEGPGNTAARNFRSHLQDPSALDLESKTGSSSRELNPVWPSIERLMDLQAPDCPVMALTNANPAAGGKGFHKKHSQTSMHSRTKRTRRCVNTAGRERRKGNQLSDGGQPPVRFLCRHL